MNGTLVLCQGCRRFDSNATDVTSEEPYIWVTLSMLIQTLLIRTKIDIFSLSGALSFTISRHPRLLLDWTPAVNRQPIFSPGGLVDLSNFKESLMPSLKALMPPQSKVEIFKQNVKFSKFSAEVTWRIKFFSPRECKRTSIFLFWGGKASISYTRPEIKKNLKITSI